MSIHFDLDAEQRCDNCSACGTRKHLLFAPSGRYSDLCETCDPTERDKRRCSARAYFFAVLMPAALALSRYAATSTDTMWAQSPCVQI